MHEDPMPPWNPEPELESLRRMKAGDEQAFVALYRRHKDAVYRFALLWTGDAACAADLTQDAFIEFLSRPGLYDPGRGTLGAWLCGIARNLARKARGLREDPVDPADFEETLPEQPGAIDPAPLARLLANETAEQVRRAIAGLAPHYRDVLVLCELSELSYAEAAQVCGIEIGTVRSRLSRARSQLAHCLQHLGGQAGPAPKKEALP